MKVSKVSAAVGTAAVVLAAIASPAFASNGINSNELVKHDAATRQQHASANSQSARAASLAAEKMTYHGGQVQTAPTVYVVFYGSQWGATGTNGLPTVDPDKEAPLYTKFIAALHGSGDNWSTSTTQYCSGVAVGATTCGAAGTHVGHPAASPLAGTWVDTGVTAPAQPSSAQIEAEAQRAATHFAAGGSNVQIIVASPHGVTPSGFGTQYCAWHDDTTVNGAPITYTNLPYLPDAAGSCGAGYVSPGTSGVNPATEGVTIVGGHEYAETVTDALPSTLEGWRDDADTTTGGENADKCAWSYGTSGVANLNGSNFAVQSLYSNNKNNNAGGCALYYNSATDQG